MGCRTSRRFRNCGATCGGRPPAGWGCYDTAFDPSLLTYFRRRLARSADPNRIFTEVRQVVAATGVLEGKHRRALDSTVLDDAVATQDTVTQMIAAIRAVIREVPGAAEWRRRAVHRPRLPRPGQAADRLERRAGPRRPGGRPGQRRARPAAATCPSRSSARRPRTRSGCWPWSPARTWSRPRAPTAATGAGASPSAPPQDRMISTVDPDARHIHKNRTHHQDGFKAHLAVEPETGLFTAVALHPRLRRRATTRPPSPPACSLTRTSE